MSVELYDFETRLYFEKFAELRKLNKYKTRGQDNAKLRIRMFTVFGLVFYQ